MKKLLHLALCLLCSLAASAQCPPGQSKIKVVLQTDNFPGEIHWNVYDANNVVVMSSQVNMSANTLYMDSICVPDNTCYRYTITDDFGDGICCTGGMGYSRIYYNGNHISSDSTYGTSRSIFVGCPPGSNCGSAVVTSTGVHTAPNPMYWYSFTPAGTGMYAISTCNLGNTCDTKLWLYDNCTAIVYDTSNLGTIYYANNNCNGQDATINAYLYAGHTYYVRVGDHNSDCGNGTINFSINFTGAVTGCMDINACNFNSFATLPGQCIYYPDPSCPTGSDVVLDAPYLSSSIEMGTTNSSDVCTIYEGCLNGYGQREIVRFSTKIDNIGQADFHAGHVPSSTTTPHPIFEYDQCHNHWHFKDYAEYLISDMNNNFIPIGYKNGFCVLDLVCYTGQAKFGCSNMGITAGCGDIYGSYLPCQWIDITDIADGSYKLIVRANWVPRPDFYGKYEVTYDNNWATICIDLSHDVNGARQVNVVPNCSPYTDCNGVVNGLTIKDCLGVCGGDALKGDVNGDSLRNAMDVTQYMFGAIHSTIPGTECFDLNDDGEINIIDAALVYDCYMHGNGGGGQHSSKPCKFPNKIKNPDQMAEFSLGSIDYVNQKVDVYIKNPDSKLVGYQIKMGGIHVIDVENLMTGYHMESYFRPEGEVIVLTADETLIPKNTTTTPLLRVGFDAINSTNVCIEAVVGVENEMYEEIMHAVVDSQCVAAIPTPNSVNNLKTIGIHHSLYPNPVTKTSNLIMNNPNHTVYNVAIYDMLGREVRAYHNQVGEVLEIEKGALTTGMYYIDVKSSEWHFVEKMKVE